MESAMVDALPERLRATGAKIRSFRHGRVARVLSGYRPGIRSKLISAGALAVVAGLWLILHPYTGVTIDARVYIGRALADLAPTTIGQDLMFRHDGQAVFSVYTLLARAAVALLGPNTAAALLAFSGGVAWFAAVVALMRQVAKGRMLWATLTCLAVLPRGYGGSADSFFGEVTAVPRPFAEAGVLAALALVLSGRRKTALVVLAAAALFHPIMAVCGFGVVFTVAALEDRRWLAGPALVGGLSLLAAALGTPIFARLFHGIDPIWLGLLRDRNPYLFPMEWPLCAWTRSSVQVGTVIIAAQLFEGRLRQVLAASAVVAVTAVLASVAFADLWPSLLIVQAQPWRALWLTAALGAAMLAPCAERLWSRGSAGKLVLATLALGWLAPDNPAAIVAMATGLILVYLDLRPTRLEVSPWVAHAALAAVMILAVARLVLMTPALWRIMHASPPSQVAPTLVGLALRLGLLAVVAAPFILFGYLTKLGSSDRLGWLATPSLGAVTVCVGLLTWNHDARTGDGGGTPAAGLTRLMAGRPGAVEWVDGDTQAWLDAGRANWGSNLQGASIVFSREQAMAWRVRMRTLIGLGFGRESILRPWMSGASFQLARPTEFALNALCREPDGPAWIVTHILDGEPMLLGKNTVVWRAPRPDYLLDGSLGWRKVTRYAVHSCERPIVQVRASNLAIPRF
jgi:hypothetical protein